jgi:2-iminoacetate synthase
VLFAPLYVSDFCINNCAYCNYQTDNKDLIRRRLSKENIVAETKCLLNMGHKRLLLEFGEDPQKASIDYICDTIETVYAVRTDKGNIRRLNINIAATTTENYRRLKTANIGTYQLFQETFHRPTYEKLHFGPKADYNRQITALGRARAAGLDDLGIGVLFGLYDWRYEVLALIEYAALMERELGVGPHTISVPRFCRPQNNNFNPEYSVGDQDFLKIVAILRIACPYTGLILSTRETPSIRNKAFKLGISQASAASVTSAGGYSQCVQGGQFKIKDDRPLKEVIQTAINDNLIPSFCTACYRLQRTGESFMNLAKAGDIHQFCTPNALLTLAEYLEDLADPELVSQGHSFIKNHLQQIKNTHLKQETEKKIDEIRSGKRDIFF